MSSVVVTFSTYDRDDIIVHRRTTPGGQDLVVVHLGDNTLALAGGQAEALVAALTEALGGDQ